MPLRSPNGFLLSFVFGLRTAGGGIFSIAITDSRRPARRRSASAKTAASQLGGRRNWSKG
jgi:hypothetical protein